MFPRLHIKQWTDFLVVVDEPVQPVLFQHLTDLVFQMLLQNHFKILYIDEDISNEMTADESSALRYIAGYVCLYKNMNAICMQTVVICMQNA